VANRAVCGFFISSLLKLLKKKPVLEGRNGVVITNLADDI